MMKMIREDPRFASLRAAVAARQSSRKPTDRLSSVAELLSIDALKHLDAESMGRLSACSRAFGKPEPARRFSLCALAAWSRLRADKAFRRPQDGKMPSADNRQAWGSEGFRGWLYVLRDWERAVAFERQGGFAAFSLVRRGGALCYTEDSDDDSYHGPSDDELNKGAFSYRRMKLALGHLEVTSDDILSWGKR